MPILFAVIAMSLFAVACSYVPEYPETGVNNFWTDDPLLEKAFLEAVKNWTDAGIVAFAYVTINIDKKGVPIKYATPEAMLKLCNSKKPEGGMYVAGCTSYSASDGHVDGIFIKQDAEYPYIVALLMHELIHVVLNIRQHNPKDGSVFSKKAEMEITQSDIDWLCKFTECIDPHLPPPRVGKKS